MILAKQKRTSKNRIYYCGQKSSKRIFEELYLTTRFEYALCYAIDDSHNFHSLQQFQIEQTANIFDMKCQSDEAALRKWLQSNEPKLLHCIDQLKDNDWSCILNGDNTRQTLVNAIRQLGYDGYFNLEANKDCADFLHSLGAFKYDDLVVKSPAIGLLDSSALVETGYWDIETIENNADYKQFRQKEQQYIKQLALKKMLEYKDSFNRQVFLQDACQLCLTLDKDAIVNVMNGITKVDFYSYLNSHHLPEKDATYDGFAIPCKKIAQRYYEDLDWIER